MGDSWYWWEYAPPTTTPVARGPREYLSYRISPGDTNRLAIIFDPVRDGVPFIACVEIYDAGGATPPNVHAAWFLEG